MLIWANLGRSHDVCAALRGFGTVSLLPSHFVLLWAGLGRSDCACASQRGSEVVSFSSLFCVLGLTLAGLAASEHDLAWFGD